MRCPYDYSNRICKLYLPILKVGVLSLSYQTMTWNIGFNTSVTYIEETKLYWNPPPPQHTPTHARAETVPPLYFLSWNEVIIWRNRATPLQSSQLFTSKIQEKQNKTFLEQLHFHKLLRQVSDSCLFCKCFTFFPKILSDPLDLMDLWSFYGCLGKFILAFSSKLHLLCFVFKYMIIYVGTLWASCGD